MEYTIKKLAEIAGVSTRTLRYYDEIGLLKPCRINSSGYRIYGEKEVDILQQILLYRSIDIKLEDIYNIITNPDFDIYNSLIEHRKNLISKRNQLNELILTVEKTIEYKRGEGNMTNKEKFEGFKREHLKKNEERYGKEIRNRYGEKTVNDANKKFLNMSEEDFNEMSRTEDKLFNGLLEVYETQDMESEAAREVYENHKKWLSFTWPSYSKEAHVGLAEMYVSDDRFAKYYNDKAGKEVVNILRDIIVKYAN